MEIYKTEDGKAIVTVERNVTRKQAISVANRYFKVKKSRLHCTQGYTKGNDLFFEPEKGMTMVWAVWTEKEGDK